MPIIAATFSPPPLEPEPTIEIVGTDGEPIQALPAGQVQLAPLPKPIEQYSEQGIPSFETVLLKALFSRRRR